MTTKKKIKKAGLFAGFLTTLLIALGILKPEVAIVVNEVIDTIQESISDQIPPSDKE